MMFETSPIRLWTGRFFVCVYCTRPKMTPTAQITRPVQRMAWPESEPLKKLTFERSGIWMSASPAEAAAALKIKRTELHHTLFFPIRVAFNAKSFSRLTIQNNHKIFGVFYVARCLLSPGAQELNLIPHFFRRFGRNELQHSAQ